jgi:ATP-dependent Lon protease
VPVGCSLREVDLISAAQAMMETEEIQIEQTDEQVRLADSLPVLPLRDIVIFPFMIVPLFTV